MKTELSILNRLKDTIAEQLNNWLDEDTENNDVLDEIDERNVKVDFPDVDNMPRNTMFYIEPDTEDIEDMTTCSDAARLNATIYILCKRDKNEVLVKKVYGYFTALYCLLRNNQDLDEFIDFSKITSVDYYPAVTATGNIAGAEINLQMIWSKDFSFLQNIN